MNETMLLQHLEELAEKLNLQVKYENLRKHHIFSRGGLCRLQEDHILLIESALNLSEKIDMLAEALTHHDLEDMYMPPAVRKLLDRKGDTCLAADTTHRGKPPLLPSAIPEDQETAPR